MKNKFKNMKFRVENPKQSEKLQKKLFELGYEWKSNGKIVQNITACYIFTDKEGNMTYFNGGKEFFNTHPNKEVNTEKFIKTMKNKFKKGKKYVSRDGTIVVCTGNIDESIFKGVNIENGKYSEHWNKYVFKPYKKEPKKDFDLMKLTGSQVLFDDEKAKEAGFHGYNFMMVRSRDKFKHISFYLDDDYNWELKRDKNNMLCLIPTKK